MVKNIQPENFETAMAELEEIVQQLQSNKLPLEEALAAYKRGIALSRYCQKTLEEAEQTIAKLKAEELNIQDNGGK